MMINRGEYWYDDKIYAGPITPNDLRNTLLRAKFEKHEADSIMEGLQRRANVVGSASTMIKFLPDATAIIHCANLYTSEEFAEEQEKRRIERGCHVKVRELILKLQECNPDHEVVTLTTEEGSAMGHYNHVVRPVEHLGLVHYYPRRGLIYPDSDGVARVHWVQRVDDKDQRTFEVVEQNAVML